MLLLKYKNVASVWTFFCLVLFSMAATADLGFSTPETLSEKSLANKTKLVRMGSGWLVSVYGDATVESQTVYDTKADDVRDSRDIFVRVCHPAHNDSQCSLASDWSVPLNISNTAHLFSIATGWNETYGVEYPIPFYGDSEKPNIFVAGNFAVVTWVSKYCPGGKQRMISYTAREGLSVPFSCLYTSYTNNVAGIDGEPAVWNTQQLTNGSRDAKSDFNKGLSITTPDGAKGKWAFSWQEDPHGLQLGKGAGPGEGASGATVTHGTDVWYTYTEDLMGTPLAVPVRISDNYTIDGSAGNTSPIFHPDDLENEIEVLERGNTGASRPNLMLVGGSAVPTAVIAYEESKGAERLDSGKFVRYHEFAFNAPPVSNGLYENGEPGCIISDPLENSRRVRFVGQPTASPNGLRMGVFWRQGFPTEGGPADIMVRVGKSTSSDPLSTGLRPEDMQPVVDPACRESDYLVARELNNVPASNISSNTVPWTPINSLEPSPFPPNDLADTSSFNPYEDSKAHRAAIVGDDFYLGYSYAKDWAVATVIDLDNYNFWMRHYNAASGSWTDAVNLSNETNVKIHIKEPRLVKVPGSGMGCNKLDPQSSAYPENCQNKNTLIVAWGTESNVYGHIGGSEEFDVYYTRTKDKGLTFEAPVVVSGIGDNNRFESQLRPSPAGNIIWTVWNEAANEPDIYGELVNTGTNSMLSVSDESVGTAPEPPVGGGTPPPPPPADSYDLLIESLEMDLDDPQIVDGIYLVPAKTNDIPARVTVKNIGGLTVSGAITVVTIGGGGFNYPFTFEELGSEETAVFDFTWDSRNKKSYTWQAVVSPTDNDRDIDNNTMRVETIIVR